MCCQQLVSDCKRASTVFPSPVRTKHEMCEEVMFSLNIVVNVVHTSIFKVAHYYIKASFPLIINKEAIWLYAEL